MLGSTSGEKTSIVEVIKEKFQFISILVMECRWTTGDGPTAVRLWLTRCCNNIKQANIGPAIFDDIARLMYNLLDAKRQWRTYVSNVKLIPVASAVVPSPTQLTAQPTDRKPSSAGNNYLNFTFFGNFIFFFKFCRFLFSDSNRFCFQLPSSALTNPLLFNPITFLFIYMTLTCLSLTLW